MRDRRRMTRDQADQLLDGAGQGPVARALDAAAAPATSAELARENATVAMFHAARLNPTPPTKDAVMRPGPLQRASALKAVLFTAIAVLFASSGLALAASSHLPWQDSERALEVNSAAASDESEVPSDGGSDGSDDASEDASDEPSDDADAGDDASEEPDDEASDEASEDAEDELPGAKGLCRAYFSGNKHEKGKSLDSTAFAALAEYAGGEENIEAFCASIGVEPKDDKGDHGKGPKGDDDEGDDDHGHGNDGKGDDDHGDKGDKGDKGDESDESDDDHDDHGGKGDKDDHDESDRGDRGDDHEDDHGDDHEDD